MKLPRFKAVLTFALVKDISLKFPARVFFGGRHVLPGQELSNFNSRIINKRNGNPVRSGQFGMRPFIRSIVVQHHSSQINPDYVWGGFIHPLTINTDEC